MHLFEEKMRKKIEKADRLESGRKQFRTIPGHNNRAYVWIGNVTFPIPNAAVR